MFPGIIVAKLKFFKEGRRNFSLHEIFAKRLSEGKYLFCTIKSVQLLEEKTTLRSLVKGGKDNHEEEKKPAEAGTMIEVFFSHCQCLSSTETFSRNSEVTSDAKIILV